MALVLSALAGCNPAGVTATASRPAATAAAAAEPGRIDTALTPEQVTAAAAITRAPAPKAAAKATAAQLDTTTAAQKTAAAEAPAAVETKLGTTVASLGDPTEGGFWIKTPLVKTRGIGRIVNPVNGKSAKVDLIPLDGPAGGGSQVSLPALQLIGVSLTDLPTIEVYKS
ncbi:hypothetical protein KNW02_04605 [Paracoccus sp. XHP0099]|uniref:D-galactarate dehydratase n=2 Tax=Paracoccus marinaquae TaxID=2841926 RepID=A0ABS6AFW0_9RHOB|nr:hypothetical protein [Paracoccus marinaquae]